MFKIWLPTNITLKRPNHNISIPQYCHYHIMFTASQVLVVKVPLSVHNKIQKSSIYIVTEEANGPCTNYKFYFSGLINPIMQIVSSMMKRLPLSVPVKKGCVKGRKSINRKLGERKRERGTKRKKEVRKKE